MNTEKNFPENTPDTDKIGFSPVPSGKRPRRKRSLFKSQIFTLIVIAVLIVGLGIGVGFAVAHFSGGDEVVDTFTESFTSKESGKVSYTYYSKLTDGGFVITDSDGKVIENYFVDEKGNIVSAPGEGITHVYQTAIGSMLRLSETGKIAYYAQVDHNGEYVGGDTGARVLIFPRMGTEVISEIFVHNVDKEGAVTEYTFLGSDSNNDKNNDYFYLKGYENASVNPIVSAALASYAGYTITVKKLSIDFMEDYDEKHKGEAGYTPLLDSEGNINFDEYGLNSENYYVLTTTGGEKHKIYFGNPAPDGSGLYVRYSSESEGDRNAVYIIADDPGVSSIVGRSVSRTSIFLSKPESLVTPQISLPTTLNTYLLVDEFIISKRQEDGTYKNITNFSYVDLSLRNFTLNQVRPYIINDPDILPGYILNDSLLDNALMDLYDISTLQNASYSSSAVENYVKVKKLVKNVLPDKLPTYYDDLVDEIVSSVEKAGTEDAELIDILKEYGLDKPENKLIYTPMIYNSEGNAVSDGIPTYIWVSEMTEQRTYYVWAPIYQQILEIGAGYLDMFTYDEFDWASFTVFDTNIAFCDSIRVTGDDKDGVFKDILFELTHEYDLTFNVDFNFNAGSSMTSSIKNSKYVLLVTVTNDGEYLLTVGSDVNYGVQYKNTQTGEISEHTETHSIDFVKKLSIDTVKNYAKYYLDKSTLDSLSSDEYAAVEKFANQVSNISRLENGKVRITYAGRDSGVAAQENSSYYYVPASDYVISFVYDPATGYVTVSVKQSGGMEVEIFTERGFANLYTEIVANDGKPEFSDEEKAELTSMYLKLTKKQSTQTHLKITEFNKDGSVIKTNTYAYDPSDEKAEGSVFITAFKNFYRTLLYATYKGRVTDTISEGVVGTVLNEEQMEAYKAQGDNCDLKVAIDLTIDDMSYVFRMYNYSVTRSYITANGDGIFYIDLDRVEKIISDAKKAASGDVNISSTTTY